MNRSKLGRWVTRAGLLALLWMPLPATAHAQESARPEFEAALLRVWADDGLTIVDGLAHVPLSILAGGTTGTYRFEFVVFDSDQTQLYRDSWERSPSNRTTAYAGSGNSTLLEPFRFGLMAGAYEVELRAYATDAPDLGTSIRLPIEAFADRPVASDLYLASRVEPLDSEGGGSWSITHGGFGIAAVAHTSILPEEPNLAYYLELYGGEEPVSLDVAAVIVSAAGEEVLRTPAQTVEVQVGGTPFAGNLPVTGLPPGAYALRLEVNGAGEASAHSAPFRMLAAAEVPAVEIVSYESTYFESLSEDELLATFGGVGYLVTETERQVFESLTMDAKRRYLTAFFQAHDDDGDPHSNPFLEEYLDRIGKVRMLYGELVGTGERLPWTTDAGKIYLRFGEPDERLVNHFPSGSDSRTVGGVDVLEGEPPYEIWSYHSTGFLYLFTEENQFGVWRMIFTTDPNMQSLADWRGRIGPEAAEDLTTKFGIQPRF
jgi:GWxTD domain-containing protein